MCLLKFMLVSLFLSITGCSSIETSSIYNETDEVIDFDVSAPDDLNLSIHENPPASGVLSQHNLRIPSAVNKKWVDSDHFHSVIIDLKTNEVLVSGKNNFNQLGEISSENHKGSFVPIGMKGMSINAVARRTYILDLAGKLWVLGFNIPDLYQIPIDNIVDFSGGFPYTYVLDNLGDVYRWQAERPEYVLRIDFPTLIVEIDGDLNHHVFLTDDGDVYGLGLNQAGQLGLGHSAPVLSPKKLPVHNVSEISASYLNTVLTDEKGDVFISGRADYLTESINLEKFVKLDVAEGVKKGFAGIDNTMVLYDDKTVDVIGWYGYKQNYDFVNLSVSNVKFLDISGGSKVFILDDGSVVNEY